MSKLNYLLKIKFYYFLSICLILFSSCNFNKAVDYQKTKKMTLIMAMKLLIITDG